MEPISIALTLASIHLHTPQDKHYNDFNPGIEVQIGKYEAGYYYNSLRKDSLFLDRKFKHFAIGVVSGYDYRYPVVPQIALYQDWGRVETIEFAFPDTVRSVVSDNGTDSGLRIVHKLNIGIVIGFKIFLGELK